MCLHEKITKTLKCKKCKEQFYIKKCPCSFSNCQKSGYLLVDKDEAIISFAFLDQPVCRYHERVVSEKQAEFEKWLSENEDTFNDILVESLKKASDKLKN